MRSKSSSVFQALCIYTFNSHDHFPRLRFLKARQLPFHILIMRHDVFFPMSHWEYEGLEKKIRELKKFFFTPL